jgi:hypothetical protein
MTGSLRVLPEYSKVPWSAQCLGTTHGYSRVSGTTGSLRVLPHLARRGLGAVASLHRGIERVVDEDGRVLQREALVNDALRDCTSTRPVHAAGRPTRPRPREYDVRESTCEYPPTPSPTPTPPTRQCAQRSPSAPAECTRIPSSAHVRAGGRVCGRAGRGEGGASGTRAFRPPAHLRAVRVARRARRRVGRRRAVDEQVVQHRRRLVQRRRRVHARVPAAAPRR